MKSLTNDERITALETLTSGGEFLDGDEENAIINVIESAPDKDIQDLHNKLTAPPPAGKKSLIKRLVDKHSDYNPHFSDANYFRLVKVLLDQFDRKINAGQGLKESSNTPKAVYPDWDITVETGEQSRDKYSSTIDDDGKLNIINTKQIQIWVEGWEWTGRDSEKTTYDNALNDVVVIVPKKGSRLHQLSGGKAILAPVLLLHYVLDETRNDELKFAIKTGVDVASFLIGGI